MNELIFNDLFLDEINNYSNIKEITPELLPLFLASLCHKKNQNLIWLHEENSNISQIVDEINAWIDVLDIENLQAFSFQRPYEDPFINNTINIDEEVTRSKLMDSINNNHKIILISTLSALNFKVNSTKETGKFIRNYFVNDILSRIEFRKMLADIGYEEVKAVEMEGQFSRTGNTVDLFPIGHSRIFTLKFDGSKIENIKSYDIKSPSNKTSCELLTLYMPENSFDTEIEVQSCKVYITEKLKNPIILSNDFESLKSGYVRLLNSFKRLEESLKKENHIPVDDIFKFDLNDIKPIDLILGKNNINGINLFSKSFMQLSKNEMTELKNEIESKKRILHLFSSNPDSKELASKELKEFNFYCKELPQSIISNKDLLLTFNYKTLENYFNLSESQSIKSFNINDYLIHSLHGIGKYKELKQVTIGDNTSDYLVLEYQNATTLLVPIKEINQLSRYDSEDGIQPKLDQIGGKTWEIKKTKAYKNIKEYAKNLLDLYAKRKAIRGNSFNPNHSLEEEFERNFKFIESAGQRSAINDMMRDLEANYPMDRLICGDVSFGKTEVALRAILRVVSHKKQVALLCPTTILANQHYKTMIKRFKDLPYKIALISRKVPPVIKKEILNNLSMGKIDIIVGTHTLLGQEVKFKDPGLFVIDEEQRFGVQQKEKLKKDWEFVDVLSLSATPIPRTLSLSLAGLCDVSIINTPPIGRKSVKNYIGPLSLPLIKESILKENERGGRSLIIYNNINKIEAFKDEISTLLPHMTIGYVHAKMNQYTIEDMVDQFEQGKIKILLATTIVENGIDIPTVNTIFIINAHKMGLTQLYQLRGRIGRSSKQGYAYFFTDDEISNPKAKDRLKAIKEFSQLGSGFKIAQQDLKLRGAGSLLGNKQHGHIEALGFDYYLELLNNAVKDLKGETEIVPLTDFYISFDISINESYINSAEERIQLYRNVLDCIDIEAFILIKEEMTEKYGAPDISTEGLLYVQIIKMLSRFFHFREVEITENKTEIKPRPLFDKKAEILKEFIEIIDMNIQEDQSIYFEYKNFSEILEDLQIFAMDLKAA